MKFAEPANGLWQGCTLYHSSRAGTRFFSRFIARVQPLLETLTETAPSALQVDLRPSAYLLVYRDWDCFVVVPLFSLMLAMASAEQYRHQTLLVSTAAVLVGIAYNACAVAAVVDGNTSQGASMFVHGVVNVGCGLLLYFDNRNIARCVAASHLLQWSETTRLALYERNVSGGWLLFPRGL